MPHLIDKKDESRIVLVGGTICTGKDTVARMVYNKLKSHGSYPFEISMTDCVRQVGGLTPESQREKYAELFKGKENSPWIARAISNAVEFEENQIVVVSGLRRKCDAAYFSENFPNSYFINLLADEGTLVERIIARNMPMDFPEGTKESEKPGIAKALLAEEEKTHRIMEMLGYVASEVPRERTYLIQNDREEDFSGLELGVYRALIKFKLV